jgi:hypothetical protein
MARTKGKSNSNYWGFVFHICKNKNKAGVGGSIAESRLGNIARPPSKKSKNKSW